MFKLHRHRSSDRVGERFDFRFSNFRAVQVALSLPPALPPSLPRGAAVLLLSLSTKIVSFPHFLLPGPAGQGRTDSTKTCLPDPIQNRGPAISTVSSLLSTGVIALLLAFLSSPDLLTRSR